MPSKDNTRYKKYQSLRQYQNTHSSKKKINDTSSTSTFKALVNMNLPPDVVYSSAPNIGWNIHLPIHRPPSLQVGNTIGIDERICDPMPTSYSRGGVNQMWILTNSKNLLEYIQSLPLSCYNSQKHIWLCTLCTTIYH
jgi:hypothetical protein